MFLGLLNDIIVVVEIIVSTIAVATAVGKVYAFSSLIIIVIIICWVTVS